MTDMSHYRDAFLSDAYASVENIRSALMYLADKPADHDALFEVMRLFHSIKSASAMMGYADMSQTCQEQEHVFKTLYESESMTEDTLREHAVQAVETIRNGLQAIQNQVSCGL
ncbi:MAG: Chemotaxis protein CheA [Candidatus Peribacteria bacterium]|nr:Chemotaxis protein CheA [Candidatus Peribacteria bacterium]